jgi:hypothetical protein
VRKLQRISETPQHTDVGHRRDASLIPRNLRPGVSGQLAQSGERQSLGLPGLTYQQEYKFLDQIVAPQD